MVLSFPDRQDKMNSFMICKLFISLFPVQGSVFDWLDSSRWALRKAIIELGILRRSDLHKSVAHLLPNCSRKAICINLCFCSFVHRVCYILFFFLCSSIVFHGSYLNIFIQFVTSLSVYRRSLTIYPTQYGGVKTYTTMQEICNGKAEAMNQGYNTLA